MSTELILLISALLFQDINIPSDASICFDLNKVLESSHVTPINQ